MSPPPRCVDVLLLLLDRHTVVTCRGSEFTVASQAGLLASTAAADAAVYVSFFPPHNDSCLHARGVLTRCAAARVLQGRAGDGGLGCSRYCRRALGRRGAGQRGDARECEAHDGPVPSDGDARRVGRHPVRVRVTVCPCACHHPPLTRDGVCMATTATLGGVWGGFKAAASAYASLPRACHAARPASSPSARPSACRSRLCRRTAAQAAMACRRACWS